MMGVEKLIRITCPFDLLKEKYIERVLTHGLNLEIGLNGDILEKYSEKEFRQMNEIIKAHGLLTTIHAPFTDLPLGSVVTSIRRAAVAVQKKALEIAQIFEAPQIVMHTGFDPKHHGTPDEGWVKRLCDSLEELLDFVHSRGPGVSIALENTFEHDPSLHEMLFDRIKQEALGFCFDLAHQVVFSHSSMERWLSGPCGERLMELHLHDNHGKKDEHLAVGEGCLDFDALFEWLLIHKKRPILTIEAHSEGAVLPALENVRKLAKKWPVA